MKLIDVVENIDKFSDELIIFQKDRNNYNSDIILAIPEEGDEGIKNEGGIKYFYLLEVFLAKEFIKDWLKSLDYLPSSNETAERLYLYAINDA